MTTGKTSADIENERALMVRGWRGEIWFRAEAHEVDEGAIRINGCALDRDDAIELACSLLNHFEAWDELVDADDEPEAPKR